MTKALDWNAVNTLVAKSPMTGGGVIAGLVASVTAWRRARALTRDLARLAETSPHLLADIGVDPQRVRAASTIQDPSA